MLLLLSVALFLIGLLALVIMPLLVGREFYKQYSGIRVVSCPENHQQVAVRLDAKRAALTQLTGHTSVRLADCSRWPEHANCGQDCIPQALHVEPYDEGEVQPTAGPIFHLPVFIAAFAAWVLGAIWHSQYLFRARWVEATGLSQSEVHQLVWQLTPHLVTFAAPLLFAYAVAMVLAAIGKQGPILGGLVAIAMWAFFVGVVVTIAGTSSFSRDLLVLELGYTLIAAAVIGLTIGELNGKLSRRRVAHKRPFALERN